MTKHKKEQRVLDSINKHGFLFDKHWIEILCSIGLTVNNHHGYAVVCPNLGDKKRKIRIHRLIVLCPDDLYVDHKNRNRADNRGRNLRVIKPLDNRLNLSAYKKKTCPLCGK